MNRTTSHARVARAQRELRRACALLVSPSPEAMAGCHDALKAAATELQDWLPTQAEAPLEPTLREVVSELQRTVGHAKRLLEAASAYRFARMRQIGLLMRGYLADGSPAGMPPGLCGVSLRA